MKRAAIYVRVSTAEQKKYGMSVDSQIDALKEYCENHDLSVVGLYNDAGKTATKYKNRSELKRMLADCRNGLADIVLFTRLDRFFRSVEDYYDCVKMMGGVPWIAIWEPDYRTDTATGRFNVNLRLSLAQHEAEQDSDRIKAVKAYARAQGHYMGGSPPIGFLKIEKRLAYDDSVREPLRLFFEDFINGVSISDCIDRLALRGISFTRSRAYRVLRSEYYYASDVPYITPEEHSIIDYRLSHIKVRKCTHPGRVHIFQGIVFCGYCGYQCSCSTRSRYAKKRGYYEQRNVCCHHNTRQVYGDVCASPPAINEEILEQLLLDNIENSIAEHNASIVASENMQNLKSISKQIANIDVRLDRLKTLFEMAEIDLEEYKSKRDKLRADRSALELSASSVQSPVPELPEGWKEKYSLLDTSGKRDFWHHNVKKIRLYKDRRIEVEL